MKLTKALFESQPEGAGLESGFTDIVMRRIENEDKKRSFWRLITFRPALTILIAIVAVSLISGVSYAVVSLLWPSTSVTIDSRVDPQSNRQQLSVYTDDCGLEDLLSNFEVKLGHEMSDDEFEKTALADCEYSEMHQWAVGYFEHRIDMLGNPSPGHEFSTRMISSGLPLEIQLINGSALTLSDGSVHSVPSNAEIISDRQQSTYDTLQVGDVVSIIGQSDIDYRNTDSCNNKHCSSEIVSQAHKVVAVVKFDFTVQDYERAGQLMRIGPCIGNEADICHEEIGGMEVFTRKFEHFEIDGDNIEDGKNARIEGQIQSIAPNKITIKTSSGRVVGLKAYEDIAERFNRSESAVSSNTYMSEGDSISVWYRLSGDQSSEIDLSDIYDITLLLEVSNRVDPPVKY